MTTQIFSGKNGKLPRYSTAISTQDKPTLIASLLEAGSLIKTQALGDPEWGEKSYKGKEDKKGTGKDSAKQHWENVTKAEVKNLKAIDSGKKKHPCAGDLAFTKHDWAPGHGAIGRFGPRGTKFRPCAWELNDGICTRENCQSSHGDELREANNWLRDTQRDGTAGGRQCRLPLTRSRREEERRRQPTLRCGARRTYVTRWLSRRPS